MSEKEIFTENPTEQPKISILPSLSSITDFTKYIPKPVPISFPVLSFFDVVKGRNISSLFSNALS